MRCKACWCKGKTSNYRKKGGYEKYYKEREQTEEQAYESDTQVEEPNEENNEEPNEENNEEPNEENNEEPNEENNEEPNEENNEEPNEENNEEPNEENNEEPNEEPVDNREDMSKPFTKQKLKEIFTSPVSPQRPEEDTPHLDTIISPPQGEFELNDF